MSKRMIQTMRIVKGTIVVETDERKEGVEIYIRENMDAAKTGEATILIEAEAFKHLMAGTIDDLNGCDKEEEEVF